MNKVRTPSYVNYRHYHTHSTLSQANPSFDIQHQDKDRSTFTVLETTSSNTYRPIQIPSGILSHDRLSSPLSTSSSDSSPSDSVHDISDTHAYQHKRKNRPTNTMDSILCSLSTHSVSYQRSSWNFTWLVFLQLNWVPFDLVNQPKLEQTLTVGGIFVDITDSHFTEVKRVRVFPRNNYLSYMGVKYQLSRIMQPDPYLDHVRLAKENSSSKDEPIVFPSPSLLTYNAVNQQSGVTRRDRVRVR
ncbi:hypothetical protein BDB01DRAFT_779627 [Pilobolus umbonatus]|nr:hypothetical protein BDB01DRAFT_779627 [Pilobolus umbonatus]